METFLLILSLVVMVVGLAGTVLPFLPSIPIVYAGFLIHGLGSGWRHYGAGTMIVFGLVTILVLLVDNLAGAIGARKYGASPLGVLGSIIGSILGLIFFSLPGLILGNFIGALGGELLRGRSWNEATRSGWGALVGFMAGTLFKIMVALIMIGSFIWMVAF